MPLTRDRRQTSRAIAGLELPDCFAAATVATEAKLLAVPAAERTEAQRRDLRRVSRQAYAIAPLERAMLDDKIAKARESVGYGRDVIRAAEERVDRSEAARDYYEPEDEIRVAERDIAIDAELEAMRRRMPIRALPAVGGVR